MKFVGRIILTCLLTVFALSTFCEIGESFAECKIGTVEIVMTTPSGKTKIKCVSYNALPGMLNAAEHSAVIVGTCPCFSPEQVEDIDGTQDNSPLTSIAYECTFENDYAWISETNYEDPGAWTRYAVVSDNPNYCHYYFKVSGLVAGETSSDLLSGMEWSACYRIIKGACIGNSAP